MEYTQDIVVNLPRERYLKLFDAPDTLSRWMAGLLAFEPLTGVPGADGATSKLTFKRGRGTMDMAETIVRRRPPDSFDADYDAKGVHNICENQFIEVDPTSTRWVAHNAFQMRGFMKVIGLLFGSNFRKESYKIMKAFKAFAEARA